MAGINYWQFIGGLLLGMIVTMSLVSHFQFSTGRPTMAGKSGGEWFAFGSSGGSAVDFDRVGDDDVGIQSVVKDVIDRKRVEKEAMMTSIAGGNTGGGGTGGDGSWVPNKHYRQPARSHEREKNQGEDLGLNGGQSASPRIEETRLHPNNNPHVHSDYEGEYHRSKTPEMPALPPKPKDAEGKKGSTYEITFGPLSGSGGASGTDIAKRPPPVHKVPQQDNQKQQRQQQQQQQQQSASSVPARVTGVKYTPNRLIPADPLPPPDYTHQNAPYEKDEPKLHLCNGVFEAYSAAYLTTRQHIINVKSEGFNLSWVNCEMASFIHMRESKSFYRDPKGEGMIMQSLDVLDFSVVHLSAFERSTRRYVRQLYQSREARTAAKARIDEVTLTLTLTLIPTHTPNVNPILSPYPTRIRIRTLTSF